MEEIKNNEFDKQKEKERDFYKTYLNSLQKRPISFKNEIYPRNADFTPLLYKHPENVYLKAVSEYQNNKEKMKKYNKKTGQFDLYLNRARKNKFVIVAEDKADNKYNNDKSKIRLKTSNSNANSKNKSKKSLYLNTFRENSTKNKYNVNNSSNKSDNYTFLTNNYKERKSNTAKKYSSQNNSNKKKNTEEKGEITIDEMVNFLLENDKEKTNSKKINIVNPINHKKDSDQRKKIIKSLNDPLNPYSAIFYNNILCKNYRVEMHYKNMEQGVPYLRIKKMKKPNLPPLTQGNILIEDKMLSDTYSSGFNISVKKKNIILPSTSSEHNKSGSKKKSNDNKNEKKENDSNILFQSYGDNTDFVNNDFELPKVEGENKVNDKEKKNLSGIIEEEN
jgi:hypothetical protein